MATLILAQYNNQPTIRGTSLTSKMIANSLCNFILVDCYQAAFFSNLVKLSHHMAMLSMTNRNFEMADQAIQPRPLGKIY
jgi:hypothetical protein